jgi:TatD DNase family protein
MGKNNKKRPPVPDEVHLLLPAHSAAVQGAATVADTHTHILSTFATYKTKYPGGKYETVFEFAKGLYNNRRDSDKGSHIVDSIIDVWCEAPVQKEWKELADSALTEESRSQNWSGLQYYFVMGEIISNQER